MKFVIASAKAPNTRELYSKVRLLISKFRSLYSIPWPLTPKATALFITYLYKLGYAASSISTFVSATAYFHKMENLQDPTSSFLVKESLMGIKHLKPTTDTRSPVTMSLLTQMIQAIPNLLLGSYRSQAYQSMVSLAFFALLRVSEIVQTQNSPSHMISAQNVFIPQDQTYLELTMTSFKHSHGQTQVVKVYSQDQLVCPVRLMVRYLQIRKPSTSSPDPLYTDSDGTPLTKSNFVLLLNSLLPFTDAPSGIRITTHSFRIGGATHAAMTGMSDSQIRLLGRWKSNAFLKYIRS